MNRPSWDLTWMSVAEVVSSRSLCESRQVGAVIVDSSNRICATGYNGPPSGFSHKGTCSAWCPRMRDNEHTPNDYLNDVAVHAETNALLFADRREFHGGTLYVTSTVCWECGKIVANSGIKRVVMRLDGSETERTIKFMQGCGLAVTLAGY